MLDELFSTIRTIFILAVVVLVIVIAIAIRKGLEQERERKEWDAWRQQRKLEAQQREREEQQHRRAKIDRIKAASHQWSREYKKWFLKHSRESLYAEEEKLERLFGDDWKSKEGEAKAEVRVDIDGTLETFYLDGDALQELERYFWYN